MNRPLVALVTLGLLAVGCTRSPPPSRSAASLRASCRAQSESAYNRQNRALLSTRDTTDTPFSSSGVSGITTNGLSREYDREVYLDNCLRGAGDAPAPAGAGTAFQGPVVQQPNLPAD